MARNRYARDYRLVETFEADGKVRVHAEYIGEAYYYKASEETLRVSRRKMLLSCATGWSGVFLSFLTKNQLTETLYTALPPAFAMIPLALLTELSVSMRFWKEPMEHRYADRLENRLPACAAILIFLGWWALIGAAICLVRSGGITPADCVTLSGAIVLTVSGYLIFRKRHEFETYTQPINDSDKGG